MNYKDYLKTNSLFKIETRSFIQSRIGVSVSVYMSLSCVPGVDGKIHTEGLAARSPKDGFSHPHQEHMIYILFSCIFYFILFYGA